MTLPPFNETGRVDPVGVALLVACVAFAGYSAYILVAWIFARFITPL